MRELADEIPEPSAATLDANVAEALGVQRSADESGNSFSTADGFWLWDIDGRTICWPRLVDQALGYGDRLLQGADADFRQLLHPDDEHHVLLAIRQHLIGSDAFDIEHRLRCNTGEYRWFHTRGEAVRDAAGIARRMVGSIRDITSERHAGYRLHDNVKRLNVLLRSLDDVVWFADPQGNVLYMNEATERIYGRDVDEFYEKRGLWLDVVDPRDRDVAEQTVTDLVEHDSAEAEYRIVCPNGRRVWIHVRTYAIRDDLGLPAGACGIATDVSARRDAEQSIRMANCMHAEIQELQSKFIADSQPQDAFNGLLRSLLSVSESEYGFIGEVLSTEAGQPYLKTHAITNIAWDQQSRDFYESNAPRGLEFTNMETLFGRVITTGKVIVANNPATDPRRGGIPDGHPPLRAFLGIPLYSRDKLVGMAGLANRKNGYTASVVEPLSPCISVCGALLMAHRSECERKKAIQDLQQTESQLAHVSRLSMLGEMVTGIAHEMNQPLAAITNYAAACREAIDDTDAVNLSQIRDWTEVICQQAIRCGDVIRRLRSFARKGESQPDEVELNDIVYESVALVASDARFDSIDVRCTLPEPSPRIRASKIQLQQVLLNLLHNACEAVAESEQTDPIVSVRCEVSHEAAELAVVDNGPGIHQRNRKMLFEPFFTTKDHGIGIGLAISRSIVQRHAGKIWADFSKPEQTTFRMTLPLCSPNKD